MKKIIVQQAEQNEIDCVNSKYDEIDFVKSNFDNEFIVIVKVENEGAGIGRLVKIDAKNIELGGIYVLPNFRGLGVAEKIVHNLCKKIHLKKRQFGVYLSVIHCNFIPNLDLKSIITKLFLMK